jgi:hypothetical protein
LTDITRRPAGDSGSVAVFLSNSLADLSKAVLLIELHKRFVWGFWTRCGGRAFVDRFRLYHLLFASATIFSGKLLIFKDETAFGVKH